MELRVTNLSLFDEKERVLQDVCFSVKSGSILCVTGHDVSTQTTLLSTLAGRKSMYEGEILVNGTALERPRLRNHVGHIERSNLFLPNLSIRETLNFSAFLRLPKTLSSSEKNDAIKEVEKLTNLLDVADTPVMFAQPLAKKCLGIACEIVERKPFMTIIEPFEGLNFRETHTLFSILQNICLQMKTGIVLSMSYPIGHVIKECHALMYIHLRQVLYYGCPADLKGFLRLSDLHCPDSQNPVEYLMSTLENFTADQMSSVTVMPQIWKQRQSAHQQNGVYWQTQTRVYGNCCDHMIRETALIDSGVCMHDEQQLPSHLLINAQHLEEGKCQEKISFLYQTWLLTKRHYLNARRRILFPISVIQNLYILVICVLVWWRPHRGEETIKDRLGLFFFTAVQWAFFALLDAVLTFPKERAVILREQGSGLYRLSAYCVAKTVSEFPLAVLQPCLYMVVIYWIANLRGGVAFLWSILVLIVDVIAAQGIGLLIGTALNPPWTISIMSLGLLSMMLWGGAFCTPPMWFRWGKFASYFTFGLNAFITIEFKDGDPIQCAESSMIPLCNTVDPETNTTITTFPSDLVLLAQGITWSTLDNVLVLLGIAIVTRVLWYICLRLRN